MELHYPFRLSPVQQGMLYHHLSAPHSGVDIEQMVLTSAEPLDAVALRNAWERLVNRHGVFRSAFEWDGRAYPVQLQRPQVSLPWQEHNLRALPEPERQRFIDDFLVRDRAQGFDLSVPPLTRAALMRTGESTWTFVWTFHHILADGQCYPSLIREAFACYSALRDGRALRTDPPRPYREFIDWQDRHLADTRPRAEAYWRKILGGFTAPTSLPGVAPGQEAGVSGVAEKVVQLSLSATTALAAFARDHELTMSTLVQAGWAFVLAAHQGIEDVVYGVTRACRRSTFAGADEIVGSFINTVPLRAKLAPGLTLIEWLKALRANQQAVRAFEHTPLVDIQRWSEVPAGSPLFESILVFTPRLVGAALRELGGEWSGRDIRFIEQTNFPLTLFAYHEPGLLLKLAYDRARFSDTVIERCLELLAAFLESVPENAKRPLAGLPLLAPAQRQTLLTDWNATGCPYAADRCAHELFEAQAKQTPHATAIAFRDAAVSYDQLNRQANQLARRLRSLDVGPGKFVGIFLERSCDLVVALLATLKAGAAYVPMDPAYPRQRLGWMLEDTQAAVVLTQRDLADVLPSHPGQLVFLNDHGPTGWRTETDDNLGPTARPNDLAYVIFTSGSSGRPKGVMVEHRNVVNFFAGMDRCLDFKEPGTWLAVTSISFDISVLELFWTLARGFKVVLQETDRALAVGASRRPPSRKMAFSLFYFAADAGESNTNRFRLLLEGARFADQNGFEAVWTPERHFHSFGGLYPNPALTSAAVAAITSRVHIRAGSVVLPLHNPIRVAEEWSVVDNLSGGRVGLSFASGWHANDFALMPQNYSDRRDILLKGIDTVRRLWRGDAVPAVSGTGQAIEARIFPAPVQSAPPIWLTSAGNVETFQTAGRLGFNVLTNLLGQTVEDLAEKLAAYRAARREAGHAGPGQVTLMLHTFVGADLDEVRRTVRGPFLEYLRTSTDLIKKARWQFPAFATAANRQLGPHDENDLTDDEMRVIMDHAFERYFQTSGLFGTPDTCLAMADRLTAAGVDEIACLIDFGVETAKVLDSLHHLNELRQRCSPDSSERGDSVAAQIRRHGVTHLQCTPSLARMLAAEPDSLAALRPLKKMLVGGEALPPGLAAQLTTALDGELINMYGPTETTVWSTAAPIDKATSEVTIGRPIANTQIYLLDAHGRPVPMGAAGELCIGGHGVVRGYLNRPELTEERFIVDPFAPQPGRRLYRTGDSARYRDDGRIEFLGRLDQQVKIRGHRIELGEIEALLARHPAVRECVVVAREQGAADQALYAYVSAGTAASNDAAIESWRALWSATYARAAMEPATTRDPTLNTAGWVSSYTNQRITDAQMREWVEHTVERILALRPRRVLEIGCGTGMLLLRIAPRCEYYHGVDFSAEALASVEAEIGRQRIGNVTLQRAAADEIAGLDSNSFDVVVLNSVVQYFPDAEYLLRVLERVVPLVREGGAIFVGDVRSLHLQEAFHASVALEQAPADTPAADVRRQARLRMERDNELVVDPHLFHALPQHLSRIRRAAIHLKRGRSHNELTRFRYDAILQVGGPARHDDPPGEPGATLSLAAIRARLASQTALVALTGLVNPRVAPACRVAALLASEGCPPTAEAVQRLTASTADGIDPEDLYGLDLPYDVELTWSAQGPDRYDATFRHRSANRTLPATACSCSCVASAVAHRPWAEYASRRGVTSVPTDLALELKELAKQQLPEFMVPTAITVLDALPRTPNGKVDRKALPDPGRSAPRTAAAYVAPTTDLERTISTVWQELLLVERVGAHDNFFDLGANSLLMVQANSRLRTALERDISLVDLFQYPSVSTLAAHLARNGNDQAALSQSQERGRARLGALQRRRVAPASTPTRP